MCLIRYSCSQTETRWCMGVDFMIDRGKHYYTCYYHSFLTGNSHSLKPKCCRNLHRWNLMCLNLLCLDGNDQVVPLLWISTVQGIFALISPCFPSWGNLLGRLSQRSHFPASSHESVVRKLLGDRGSCEIHWVGPDEKMAAGVLRSLSGVPVTSFASPRACGELPWQFPQLHGPPGDFPHSAKTPGPLYPWASANRSPALWAPAWPPCWPSCS